MAEQEQPYATRWFNARLGEVGLTCCMRCGAIVWNPTLHERTYHGKQEDSDENSSAEPGLSEVGLRSGSSDVPERPRPGSTGSGAGRTTAAGTGKQSRR